MPLLRRLFGRGPAAAAAAPAPEVDPACGDAELRLMQAQAAAGDWAALRAGLSAVTDEADLTWLVAEVAETPGSEVWLAETVAAQPEDASALLLSGARQVSWAWEARTRARAQHVSREQWQVFGERLEAAEEQLYAAAEREPSWLAPWYFLQISGRGASLGPDVARYRFEAALRRRPDHLGSHRQRLQQLCPKWGGSREEMHEFARGAMLAAPEGSPLGELVALAHIEHWLELDQGDDRAYIGRKDVREQLHEAAERSVLHPAYRRGRGWQSAFNTFAMAFSIAGQPATAELLFRELDSTVTRFPWAYLNSSPGEAFRQCREAAARA
ncbi:hypothetical protein [Kitasatospora paracochleata]|uniref:DUF4034 domain-containing protein n=1 Tax=Kitasatospora paracochleata TaxID=58354 RepID=A0ABT1J9J9_9ACTN|nr:hypothetical protein [Kitasatospora paracochleata]MCP2313879.1 hypothetical protein [Kitasatospora paracochleata]